MYMNRHVIVFCITPLNAVILHDRCFLVVPEGADSMLSAFMNKLREPVSTDDGEVSTSV